MRTIFVAATHTAKSRARSGIQTVVCGLLAGLTNQHVDLRAVRWIPWRNALFPLKRAESERLPAVHSGESLTRERLTGAWLVLPEVIYRRKQQRVIRYARKQNMRVAAILHDAIPVSHPELVRRQAAKYHAEYMTALCDVDLVIATSNCVAADFRSFIEMNRLCAPQIFVCRLPGELIGQQRAAARDVDLADTINILCVSTLEPRKNHKTLLAAFNQACAALPQYQLRLHLAGDRYYGADDILETVQAAVKQNPNVIWHGKVNDEQLAQLYRDCDFTVYPSVLEGFGLPITESLWQRRPCICANFGAMAETAEGGGCFMVDVRDSAKLRDAIVTLATDRAMRQALVDEIEMRPLKTWNDYAREIVKALEAASI